MKSENEKQLTDTGAVVKEKFGFISRKLTTTTKLAEDHKRRLTLKSQQWGENAERLKTSVSSLMERLNRCEEENGRLESLNIELNHTKVTFVQRIDGLEEKLKETNDNKTTLENSSQTERGRDGKLEREQEKYDMLESRFNDLQKTQASSGCCSNCKKIKEEVSDVQVLRIQLEQLEGEKSSLVQSNCHYLQERERLFATLRRKDEQLVEKQKELAQVQHQFAQMRSPKQSGRA